MLLQKPTALWISTSLFVVLSITMTPLVSRLRHRSADRPRTLVELGARLSQGTPPLHVVWQHEEWPESSMWVSVRPRSRKQLWGLVRDPERIKKGQWQGIVFCERPGKKAPTLDEFIRDNNWGEYGRRVGPFVLFGDPVLLQRIRAVILDLLVEAIPAGENTRSARRGRVGLSSAVIVRALHPGRHLQGVDALGQEGSQVRTVPAQLFGGSLLPFFMLLFPAEQ